MTKLIRWLPTKSETCLTVKMVGWILRRLMGTENTKINTELTLKFGIVNNPSYISSVMIDTMTQDEQISKMEPHVLWSKVELLKELVQNGQLGTAIQISQILLVPPWVKVVFPLNWFKSDDGHLHHHGRMVEVVDTTDLKSVTNGRVGSSPTPYWTKVLWHLGMICRRSSADEICLVPDGHRFESCRAY